MENGKKICRVIRIISKIACIISIVGICLMIIIGMFIPYVASNSDWLEQLEIIENKGLITIDVDSRCADETRYVLDNYTETEQIIIGESYCLIGIVSLALLYLVFNKVYKLFYNIENGSTPFTEDNIKLIKNITNKTILFVIVPGILATILEMIIDFSVGGFISISSIIIVLILYAIGHVFEYGYKLQLEADETL